MTIRKETTDTILARIDQRLKHIEDRLARFDDHERRIRSLEAYKNWLIGGVAFISAAITYLIIWLKGGK